MSQQLGGVKLAGADLRRLSAPDGCSILKQTDEHTNVNDVSVWVVVIKGHY